MNGSPDRNAAPPAGEIPRLAEHLFRHEAGNLVSVLTGMFEADRLQLAEDVVQEALIRALKTWPYYESTDWRQILALYDRLLELDASPVVALNRAVAVANVDGPKAGIEAVEAIPKRGQLDSYYLLYAVLGEFESQLSHFPVAANHLRKALQLTEVKSEQSFLSKRLRECEEQRLRTLNA